MVSISGLRPRLQREDGGLWSPMPEDAVLCNEPSPHIMAGGGTWGSHCGHLCHHWTGAGLLSQGLGDWWQATKALGTGGTVVSLTTSVSSQTRQDSN